MGTLPGERGCLCFIDGESKVPTQEHAVEGSRIVADSVGGHALPRTPRASISPSGSFQEGPWTGVDSECGAVGEGEAGHGAGVPKPPSEGDMWPVRGI